MNNRSGFIYTVSYIIGLQRGSPPVEGRHAPLLKSVQ